MVVGKILSMEKHPDSDHMWICQIDVGQAEPIQIVTGAWNIHVGDLVPVAQHKSLLPGGMKIEKGKLRGVVSNGMLCSLKELSLTAEHDYPLRRHHPRRPAERLQASGSGEALHPRRHQGRGQGVRPRGLRQGAGM